MKGGRQPVAEWLDDLATKFRAVMDAKIEKLAECDLELLGTEMLIPIKGYDKDLYELRGEQCRIAVFYNRSRRTFVLLCGWLKKRDKQEHDITLASGFLKEYLQSYEGAYE